MFLEIAHLRVQYSSRTAAVDNASFGLRAGEIGVMIGPSGCGKTTLLRAIAGLEPVQDGSIRLSGEVVSASGHTVPPEKRHIGMVFQDYALFPHLDVGHSVGFGIDHVPKKKRSRRVAEALELVGLGGIEKRLAHELSGGQQHVALARALAPQPRLLLLDEPFSNLDVELRERLAHEVRGILKAAGATAMFVTHDQLEAFAIGDLIGVMHHGRCTNGQMPTRCTTALPPVSLPTLSGTACSHRPRCCHTGADSAGCVVGPGEVPTPWRLQERAM